MTELVDVPWPPTPIRTARLLLRETEARDRPGFIDLFASDDVRAWGRGYATEAVGAALEWVTEVLPGEPVVLCTQSANEPSVRLAERLGFAEVERFKEFDAEQWFGVWTKTGAT
ncbi:GNAT family N-acetyltransferase [Kribbella sp. CWNU-51]